MVLHLGACVIGAGEEGDGVSSSKVVEVAVLAFFLAGEGEASTAVCCSGQDDDDLVWWCLFKDDVVTIVVS